MKFLIILLTFSISFINVGEELNKCEWKNVAEPCLTIFSAPNTSKITEGSVGKQLLQKTRLTWLS